MARPSLLLIGLLQITLLVGFSSGSRIPRQADAENKDDVVSSTENVASTQAPEGTTKPIATPSNTSPAPGTTLTPTSTVKPKRNDCEEYLDKVVGALSDAMNAILPNKWVSLLLGRDEESSTKKRAKEENDDDDYYDEDDDGEDYDWRSILWPFGKRRRRSAGKDDVDLWTSSLDPEYTNNEIGSDDYTSSKQHKHFLATLRKVFFSARNKALSSSERLEEDTDLPPRNEMLKVLLATASRAFNASEEEVVKAFDGMTTKWVGQALFDTLFPRAHKADKESNGKNYNSLKNEVKSSDLDLSPTSVSYFLLELLGTMAGISWGAWYSLTHSASHS